MPDVNTPVKTASQDTPKSVKFSEKSPERISPKPVQDTHTDTDVTFLLMKIKSMSMAEVRSEPEPELSFSMPANLDLPEFSADISHSDVSGDLLPLTPINLEASVIASHGGDFSLRPQNLGLTSTLSTHLTTLALQHEAELLEKDKEIAALQKEMAEMENEEVKVIEEIRSVDHRNASLRIAVSNLEESVDNIHLKHENDVEGLRMSQSRASQDISVAQTDLQVISKRLGFLLYLSDVVLCVERQESPAGHLQSLHQNQGLHHGHAGGRGSPQGGGLPHAGEVEERSCKV